MGLCSIFFFFERSLCCYERNVVGLSSYLTSVRTIAPRTFMLYQIVVNYHRYFIMILIINFTFFDC